MFRFNLTGAVADRDTLRTLGECRTYNTESYMSGILDKERIIAGPGFNRWLVPPAALAIHLCIGMAYGFSVFWLPLSKAPGIKDAIKCGPDFGFFQELFTTFTQGGTLVLITDEDRLNSTQLLRKIIALGTVDKCSSGFVILSWVNHHRHVAIFLATIACNSGHRLRGL